MTLGGLWHGASWNFVYWGIWHGLLLCLTRGWKPEASDRRLYRLLATSFTFLAVLIGWTLFRTASIGEFALLWNQILRPAGGLLWLPPLPLIALSLLIVEHAVWLSPQRELLSLRPDRWYTPWAVGFAIAALVLFAPSEFRPFVYFQF